MCSALSIVILHRYVLFLITIISRIGHDLKVGNSVMPVLIKSKNITVFSSSSLKKGSVSIFLHRIIATALVHQQTGGLPHLLLNVDTTKQDHKSTVENMI